MGSTVTALLLRDVPAALRGLCQCGETLLLDMSRVLDLSVANWSKTSLHSARKALLQKQETQHELNKLWHDLVSRGTSDVRSYAVRAQSET